MSRKGGNDDLLAESALGNWRLMEGMRERIGRACEKLGTPASFADSKRRMELGDYLCLFLFGLINPAVRTMRGLCAASHLERVQKEVCARPVSLGSFSEAQQVIDLGLLEEVFAGLAREVNATKAPRNAADDRRWHIVDSTLWEALPRMHWALWRNQGCAQHAVRLHLSLNIVDDKPVQATMTSGRFCERRAWRGRWKPGDAYVGDRYFGEDYRFFGELDTMGCAYVLRLRDVAVFEIEEELPVGEEDARANVLRHAWGHLGCKKRYRSARVRLVWVQTPKEVLLLVTHQTPGHMSASLVAQLYRQRWQVELFFRWIKCILGCRHWLAESPKGVAIQIYLALIAALLLQLHSGKRPNRRMMELIQLHLMGVASLEELENGLARELAALERAKNKKTT